MAASRSHRGLPMVAEVLGHDVAGADDDLLTDLLATTGYGSCRHKTFLALRALQHTDHINRGSSGRQSPTVPWSSAPSAPFC